MTDSGAKSLLFYKNGTLTQYHSPEMGGNLSGIAVTDGPYVWTADQNSRRSVIDRLDLQAKRVVDRVGGADRYEVSAHVSAKAYPDGTSTVFVASGEVFADALSVGPIAARAMAPVLLTSRDTLPGSVADELSRLKPEQVIVVGGTVSVSKAVEAAITARAPGAMVSRIDGPDRYSVSRALLNSTFAPKSSARLFIANGGNFPDALSSGPAAAASQSGVLLVNGATSALSSQELDLIRTLVTSGGTVEIVGGPNSVSPAIEAQIRGIRSVERIGGADRFEVSQALNARVFPRPARSYLASGTAFADALAGGAAAGAEGAPLYLSRPECIPGAIAREAVGASVAYVTLLGGPVTLTSAVENLNVCP